jgi:hypothetical protein
VSGASRSGHTKWARRRARHRDLQREAAPGQPRDIPLNAHAQIQLEVSTPLIAPETITWRSSL